MPEHVQDHELHEEREAEAAEEDKVGGQPPHLEVVPHEIKVQIERSRVEEAQTAEARGQEAGREVEPRDLRQAVVPGLDSLRHALSLCLSCDCLRGTRWLDDALNRALF